MMSFALSIVYVTLRVFLAELLLLAQTLTVPEYQTPSEPGGASCILALLLVQYTRITSPSSMLCSGSTERRESDEEFSEESEASEVYDEASGMVGVVGVAVGGWRGGGGEVSLGAVDAAFVVFDLLLVVGGGSRRVWFALAQDGVVHLLGL